MSRNFLHTKFKAQSYFANSVQKCYLLLFDVNLTILL